MNPFLRYLADKNSAHTQTDRQTDRHTPMTTRPCGLRRAGNDRYGSHWFDVIKPTALTRPPAQIVCRYSVVISYGPY